MGSTLSGYHETPDPSRVSHLGVPSPCQKILDASRTFYAKPLWRLKHGPDCQRSSPNNLTIPPWDGHGIDIGKSNPGFLHTITNGLNRQCGNVFDADEPFFLLGGDNATVFEQSRRSIPHVR